MAELSTKQRNSLNNSTFGIPSLRKYPLNDKEHVLKGNKWVLTRTGYCLAEKSAVNGKNDFYKKVYVNTTYNECSQFEPCS